ncbi:hypothetical protein ACM55G_07130 [Flavobacterium sp. LB3P122]|uniref:hypothetical protein n=1 Tax=Flavobacterium algoriphilum TaxID=3398738 RepID=UPI003A84E6F9
MNKITFEEYKSAIRVKYEVSKSDDVSGILLNPTPAQLRNLCLMKLDKSLTNTDGDLYRIFFNVKEEVDLRKTIENFDIGKFKPIISFLKGEKDSGHPTRIELAAVLVNFNPRPYNKYLSNGNSNENNNLELPSLMENEKVADENLLLGKFIEKVAVTGTDGKKGNNDKTGKKTALFCAVVLSLFFMGYTVKGILFPKKECMQWEGNHYIAVDCANDKLGIGQLELIVPIDENIMKLNKLDSNRKLSFFKNHKPLVWYCKHDGVVELFNAPGFHPETGKPLKPITKYMIKKYSLQK